ncbi:bifunctional riboflavin kinase/FAD synthetase [Allorhodopirellula solitaria]|uniref:Bifunctional riboflavin kinase/FMN adenylyltransferase n=1 Tax=Allorhodopirellula solitaria TaxID=2527987 RepID=A0A5C5YI11_9BACT|nr:bifunctional riboflavin kinase/FAD synthetase [Allorhodopirellula solitaria]TWT73952.1 Riboflavin biosynthesis protein RibF [Allorhodopirellula solitaria]
MSPPDFVLLIAGVLLGCALLGVGYWAGRRNRRLESYRVEAHTDAMTGLANRRAFDKQLDSMCRPGGDRGSWFTLALIDIDHFKAINDTHGHPAGDVVLQRVAAILASGLPGATVVARFGGDEFAVVMPAPTQEVAGPIDQLRRRVAATSVEVGPVQIEVSISVGVSEFRGDEEGGALVRRADERLYRAKNEGRNRVCFDAALTESGSIRHTGGLIRSDFENDTHLEMTSPCPAPILTCTLDELETNAAVRDRVKQGAVSIGNFDGVHVGHRELLGRVAAAAERVGGPAVVVVLDPHPATVLRPHSAPARLTTIARRAELMGGLGIDALVVCPATQEFLNRTADDFFDLLISDRLQAEAIVEGPNFFFGRDRGGDVNRLRTLCQQTGKSLEVVEPRLKGQRMVSSSRIREAIAAGEIASANAMLQSVYQVRGQVARGEGRGRTLGFPTANLVDIATLVPGHGVYAALVTRDATGEVVTAESSAGAGAVGSGEDGSPLLAAVHVGPNPTFDDDQRTKVEVHCLDYDGDLYDQMVTVHWLEQIRGVEKFDSADALAEQIRRDVAAVRQFTP